MCLKYFKSFQFKLLRILLHPVMTFDNGIYDIPNYTHFKSFKDGTREYYNDYNQLHRIDGPAVIWGDGIDKPNEWWENGEKYNPISSNGYGRYISIKRWEKDDQCHRVNNDLPALIRFNITCDLVRQYKEWAKTNTDPNTYFLPPILSLSWCKDGLHHREGDLPAYIEYRTNGHKVSERFYKDGKIYLQHTYDPDGFITDKKSNDQEEQIEEKKNEVPESKSPKVPEPKKVQKVAELPIYKEIQNRNIREYLGSEKYIPSRILEFLLRYYQDLFFYITGTTYKSTTFHACDEDFYARFFKVLEGQTKFKIDEEFRDKLLRQLRSWKLDDPR